MLDPFDEPELFAQRLVSAVAAAVGRTPCFDGLQIRSSVVVVVNAGAGEQQQWADHARLMDGPNLQVLFVERPLGPKPTGVSMLAARGCGSLDFQNFECGCRGTQIPGEDDWQLIRGIYCRFAAAAHVPGHWPLDGVVRPIK